MISFLSGINYLIDMDPLDEAVWRVAGGDDNVASVVYNKNNDILYVAGYSVVGAVHAGFISQFGNCKLFILYNGYFISLTVISATLSPKTYVFHTATNVQVSGIKMIKFNSTVKLT